MPPMVSVIIATFNYGKFLPQALDSLLSQTFADWEAIVVDDGSTDNTAAVITPYLADLRIRYIRTDHCGAAGARNAAIRESTGEFLAILDADDSWLPQKLERQMALFAKDLELGVVYSSRSLFTEDGCALPTRQAAMHREWVLPWLFKDNFVCFSSAVFRREALDDAGLFDVRWNLSEDYDLLLRVARRYRFDYVDEPLVRYRTRDYTVRAERNLKIVLDIMKHFLDDCGGREMIDAWTIRRAYAETYLHIGQCRTRDSRFVAAAWYARSLVKSPLQLETWKEAAKLLLPPFLAMPLQRLLGRADSTTRARRTPQEIPIADSRPD